MFNLPSKKDKEAAKARLQRYAGQEPEAPRPAPTVLGVDGGGNLLIAGHEAQYSFDLGPLPRHFPRCS